MVLHFTNRLALCGRHQTSFRLRDLPGIMFSIARSRLALPLQLSFLGVHSIGLLLGTIYTSHAPNLYENNSHNRLGWVVTWVVVVQCIVGVINLATTIAASRNVQTVEERISFLPVLTEAMVNHPPPSHSMHSPDPYRYSDDSGHFTASRSESVSSTQDHSAEEEQKLRDYEATHNDEHTGSIEKDGLLPNPKVGRFARRVSALVSRRTMKVLNFAYNPIDRVILLLGFITFITGAVVYGGVFVSLVGVKPVSSKRLIYFQRHTHVFSGLAHTIKGGIFFWYGLLTLGRWMGCFSQYGWAWNVKPPVGVISKRQSMVPSAEFTESFVIFFYGSTNVFLEHLGHSTWSAQDLEHVSISVMFFGGGLAGMLVESSRVRGLLNSVILTSSAAHASQMAKDRLTPPKTYSFPMNPFPALIILLLGIMMSSHHQTSMFATMVHKQWGMLFMGFALARAVTYVLTYISPPTSYLPSRPPSELVTSFCLISGGIIFMASNTDTVQAMEDYNLHAMFLFTVTMGFTCALMAWVIIVLAVKGWAVRRQSSGFATAGLT